MLALFWISVAGVLYSYFLYPLVLLALPKRSPAPEPDAEPLPRLSVIIAAHDEAGRIADKLEDTLAVDYPPGLREVIVASDASADATDQVVAGFADRGVRLVRAAERGGKEAAQRLAIEAAGGEILVFSDAATRCPPESFRHLVRAFADPAVGAVSSEDRVLAPDGRVMGEGAYVRYEMWLRRLESRVRGLVGLSGSFFAVRRALCDGWDTRVPSDFNAALRCARTGHVAVSDPRVLGLYPDIQDDRREYARKVRTVVRGLATVFYQPSVLNPFRFGLFAFQVWSHKLFRWLVPWFLVAVLVTSAAGAGDAWYCAAALGLQGLFYTLALAGWASARLRRRALCKIPFFFTQVNAAIAHATLAFLAGRRITIWSPSAR